VIWVLGGIARGFNGVLAEALELVRGSIAMGIDWRVCYAAFGSTCLSCG
jgi:hypothetical protein